MSTPTDTTARPGAGRARTVKPSPAERLLDTASTLFAEYGIRAIGIDRVLAEAGVARASLYSSYGSKDALVTAYLEDLDRRDRVRFDTAILDVDGPVAKILTFFDLATDAAPGRNFRGCQYANAATEFPHERIEPIIAHRVWLRETLVDLLVEAGAADPDGVAQRIQVIYDGALAGSKFEHSVEPIRQGRELAAAILAAAVA